MQWLRLSGTRYRCTPMYAPSEELDPLAQLFLKVLKNERDRDIGRLVRAFGLTARVVEDVLGDLIRRNRASLVISGGKQVIRPLDDSIPNVSLEAGDPLDVWQEHVTGLVVPAYLVDRFKNGNAKSAYALKAATRLVESFAEAPDAQLIEMLVRADEILRQREESYGTLDRLADRFQLRPQLVWLPVIEADLGAFKVPQIIADDVPSWMVRIWSIALRSDQLRLEADGADLRGLYAASPAEVLAIVEGWRASSMVNRWRSAVSRFLATRPAPSSGYELRGVRDCYAAFADYTLSVGRVEIVGEESPSPGLTWISEVVDSAKEWLVVVLSRPAEIDGLTELLHARVAKDERVPGLVMAIVPEELHRQGQEAKLQEALGITRVAAVSVRKWPSGNFSMILGDSGRARVQYLPSAPPLEFTGDKIVGELLAVLQNLPFTEDRADRPLPNILRTLRVRRPVTSEADKAQLGSGEEAPTISVAAADLKAFGALLLDAIVDPERVHQLQAEPLIGEQAAAGWRFNPELALEDQLPVLTQRLEVLSGTLSAAPRPPWVLWRRLTSYDLLPTVVAVLSYPAIRPITGEIVLLSAGVGDLGLSPPLLEMIKIAIQQHGWIVKIGFPSTLARHPQQAAKLKSLRETIPDRGLELLALRASVPAPALVLGDMVFLGNTEWLEVTENTRNDITRFGLSLESQGLSEDIRSSLVQAEAIRLK